MALTSVLELTKAGTRVAGPRLLVAGTALALVLVQLRAPTLVLALFGALAVAVLAYVANRHPRAAAAIGLLTVAGLPVYAGRYVGGTQFGLTPALVVSLVLLPMALQHLPRWRLTPMDVAVLLLVLLRLLSTALNLSLRFGAFLGPALEVALPYVAFRLLSLRTDIPRVAAQAVVAIATALAVFAIFEHAGLGNAFFRLPSNGYAYRAFAQEQLRFGEVRAEASFGHSIALGMFLALALVLAVALAVEVRDLLRRGALVVAAGLLLLGTLDTLSRGALLTLAVGVVLWFLLEFRRLKLSTVAGLALAAAALIAVTPVSSTVSRLVSSGQGNTNEAASTEHRVAILDIVTDPAQFSLLGKKGTGVGSITDQVEARTGLGSYDNAYALVYVSDGLLPALAFLAVGALAFGTLAARGLTNIERAWAAALSAGTVNLFTVNLLTQYETFYWIAAALAASAWQRLRADRRARNSEPVRSPA